MNWGYKLASSPDDVLAFLNGVAPYDSPVDAARICASRRGAGPGFHVFYRRPPPAQPTGDWGWKPAADPDDVRCFLGGSGDYAQPVKDAQVAACWNGNLCEFHVFYKYPAPGEQAVPGWAWKFATTPADATNSLNGTHGYGHPATTARITTLVRNGLEEFHVFHQPSEEGGPVANWAWRLATSAEDARHFVNGTGAYQTPVKGFEIDSVGAGGADRFWVFVNQGTQLWLQSPLANERFVQGETVHLRAQVTSEQSVEGSALRWTSGAGGPLGHGPHIVVDNLPPGAHTFQVAGYGQQRSGTLRSFADLGALYEASPSPAEVARIGRDLDLLWYDGSGTDETWSAYPFVFDQHSTDPSKLVIFAKLDVLRHQSFSEPLPFTNGQTIYDHFKSFVHGLTLTLDCNCNAGIGDRLDLHRSMSVWDARASGTADNPDACKVPFPNPTLHPYVNPLYLLIHEERHTEPGDPGHVMVGGIQMDPYLENGSGHAWAALYTMWVYKYGRYDPPAIKEEARQIAKGLLEDRFVSTPIHSDPKVQAIIDELLHS